MAFRILPGRSSQFWVILALAAETVLLLTWEANGGDPMILFAAIAMGVYIVGLISDQRWIQGIAVAALVVGWLAIMLDLAVAANSLVQWLFVVALVCLIGSVCSRVYWQRVGRYQDPADWDDAEGEQREPTSLESWLTWLRPRSRTAMLQALTTLCLGLVVLLAGWEMNIPEFGVTFFLPELVLAGAFWFHQDWIRWYGPALCLAWAALVLLACGVHPAILALLLGAVRLRRIAWEW
jgi:hypothetical protein